MFGVATVWSRLLFAACVALLLSPTPNLLAHDPEAEEVEAAPEPDWDFELGLSYLATTGNSDTSSGGLNALYKKDWEPWSFEASAFFLRAEDSGSTTAERYGASLLGARAINANWALTAGLTGERDLFSGIDFRSVVSAGVKWLIVDSESWVFNATGALTWTNEDLGGDLGSDDYIGALFGLNSKWVLSANSEAFTNLLYFPNFDNSDDYRFEGEAGLRANLNTRLALQLTYGVRYDNVPVPGFEKTDTVSTASIVVKLPSAGS
ncbi:MAG: DUF481 domain-containing protein [Deltaproteobacteria bacterium]|nr:DUF481 domain-containing protein [Deltaproteobacteria bacterium]